ncbi:MAG: GNAT family N-acetyltransferase [Halobacteria archaeon]
MTGIDVEHGDPRVSADREYVHREYLDGIDRYLGFRPVSLGSDLPMLHRWLGYEHVKPYWKLDLPLTEFRERMEEKIRDEHLTPYVGFLDHVPMSYWELYWTDGDVVSEYYESEPGDQGLHLLFGPPEYLGNGYATPLMRSIVGYQFGHPETERVVAEPDARNDVAIKVFENCGFQRRGEIEMENKTALLMECSSESFEQLTTGNSDDGGNVEKEGGSDG